MFKKATKRRKGKRSLHFLLRCWKNQMYSGCVKRSMVPKARELRVLHSIGAQGLLLNTSL
jgi:hypothetical protein